jgi:hypothetical protein
MFTDNPNLIKLDEKIFWYKNFLSKEEVDRINNIVKDTSLGDHWFEEIEFKVTPTIPELMDTWNKVSEFLQPTHVIHPLLSMIYFGEGKQMLPHCDSPGEDHAEELTVPDVWSTCCLLDYGVITYFGEFTGGELYYPNQDIVIPVQPGDLVIHGALKSHSHGVKPVTSGMRYAYSNFSVKAEKNPGTFYNYGTPENEARQKDFHDWCNPLIENEKSVKMSEIIYED